MKNVVHILTFTKVVNIYYLIPYEGKIVFCLILLVALMTSQRYSSSASEPIDHYFVNFSSHIEKSVEERRTMTVRTPLKYHRPPRLDSILLLW